ncbi:MAG TPA: adenylate/guanylate cyclase domain-containing protein [Nitriliruptorales bacterium]|nr:adenylate/guanylate cyclase domain-containing protein [Nitriliruptorales bacterium]
MTGEPASHTSTFLFTDLESSTQLWERSPTAMQRALERHDAILREAVERADGRVVKTTGDGLMAVFPSAAAAVGAALDAQLRLKYEVWGETGPLRVRMGMHAGEAQTRADDFFGPPVYRAARIMSSAHGGQVLLSALAADLVADVLPPDADLRDLGEHRLKDLLRPERLFQLVHPDLPTDFPPLVTLSYRPNNLPTQTSEFVGRERELATLRDLLGRSEVRLLTLIGPGGIGKTRLALQAAADQIDRFEDGLYFVDLSATRDPDAAFESVLRAVGLRRLGDEQPLDVLARQLGTRHVLLLLDNLEQVIAAADGVVELLQRCPQLKVLVTSREALRVRGEHLLPVPPLSLPGDAHASLTEIADHEAIRLFVERSRQVQPSFQLTEDNAAAVAEICARLDGLPLAIELAAARMRLFSVEDLRERLRSRLELLRGGPRDLPARQQTLRSTVEWSYDLLHEDERALFQLLSLFWPPRVDTLEGVAARVDLLRDVDVVDGLASLLDKSLIRSMERPGQHGLSMFETIREYAAERLDEDPELARAARLAHAEFFSALATSGRDRLDGPDRQRTLDELAAEIGNLRAAWSHWVDAADLQRLNQLLDPLWVLHDARGWYSGAVGLAEDLLGVLSALPPSVERAQEKLALVTSLARGLLAIRGYTQEVEDLYRQALARLEGTGRAPERPPALRSLASIHLYRGEFAEAAAIGRELLELARLQGDVGLEVEAHLVLGVNVASLGDAATGLEHLDRAIALFDPERHRPGRLRLGPSPGVVPYTTSAFLLWLQGFPDRAVQRATSGLELATRLDHPFSLAYALFHVGFLDLWRRELDLVHQRASGALEVAEEHGYQVWKALALVLQGVALTGLGRPDQGLASVDRGFSLYQGLDTPPVFWDFLLSLRARGLALGGKPQEGLATLEPAFEMAADQAPNIFGPEFPILKGDLLLALSDARAAEPWFQAAFDTAAQVGARTSQLRAATRLTRLRRAAGTRPDGTDLLRDVYATFTEGFDTPDLVEARALLDEVNSRV